MVTFLAVALMTLQGVATGPSFSGIWVLDPVRSTLYPGGARELQLVIIDRASTIQITDRRQSRDDEYAVPSDGQPHQHTASGAVYVRTLRRENGALSWQVTMTRVADKASISYAERWSLSDGGRTLTVYTAYPGGRDVVKVFARKD